MNDAWSVSDAGMLTCVSSAAVVDGVDLLSCVSVGSVAEFEFHGELGAAVYACMERLY